MTNDVTEDFNVYRCPEKEKTFTTRLKILQATHTKSNKDTQNLATLSVAHKSAALASPRSMLEMLLASGPSY